MLDKVEVDITALMEVDTENVPPSLRTEDELINQVEDVVASALYDLLPEGAVVELVVTVGGLE